MRDKAVDNNKNLYSGKIKRGKFFLYTGVLTLGMAAAFKLPFNIFGSNQTSNTRKNNSIKISQNPNAVKRNSRQENNG